MATTTTPVDFRSGDRVRCYDTWNGTVVRMINSWLGTYAIVDYDHYEGQVIVYIPYIQPL